MASFLDKVKIKTAVTDRTKLDLSCDHISSADFMQFNVAYCKEVVPKEKLSVSMETFTRMEPLVVPTFGRANIKNRAFFVPFRTVFPAWNDFITSSPHIAGNASANGSSYQVVSTPLIRQYSFWTWLLDDFASGGVEGSDSYVQSNFDTIDMPSEFLPFDVSNRDEIVKWLSDHPSAYDYVLTGTDDTSPGSGTSNAFLSSLFSRFTGNKGYWRELRIYPVVLSGYARQAMKIMNSLGYVFSTRLYAGMDSSNPAYQVPYMSALPLLCLCKVYADWYFPSAYDVTKFDYLFNHDIQPTANNDGTLILSADDYRRIFDYLWRVSYDADYFVSAWDSPSSPNGASLSGEYKLLDINNNGNRNSASNPAGMVSYPSYNTNFGTDAPTVNAGNSLSKYALDALASLSDYLKRHQLAGVRSIDRFLARFGINLSAEKLRRSIYLGLDTIPLQIGDVMSSADTVNENSGMPLGSYAGKGLGYGSKKFEWDSDEYGMFIIVSTIVPAVGYYQGIDRTTLHTTPLSFYTPEFDSLGVQAISRAELYEPTNSVGFYPTTGQTSYYDMIFGFTPRYAEYKIGRDRLTGDKRMGSMSVGQDSWNLMRQVSYEDYSGVVHSESFVRGYSILNPLGPAGPRPPMDGYHNVVSDIYQYDRIFQNTDYTIDHFNVIYHCNVVSYSPMSSLFDNYEWKDHDKGETVRVDANGVKMN